MAKLAGRGVVVLGLFRLRPSFFLSASLARQRICVVSVGRQRETAAFCEEAKSSRRRRDDDGGGGGGVAAVGGNVPGHACCCTLCGEKQGIEADVQCPVFAQSRPSDANCIFGRRG